MNITGRIGAGRLAALSQQEKGLIATAITYLARAGLPCDQRDFSDIVTSFAKSMGRQVPWKAAPGNWIRGSQKRWSGDMT